LKPHIVILSQAVAATLNFRGPLIRELLAAGWAVTVLAPDHDDASRHSLADWGAAAVAMPLVRTGMNPFSDLRTLFFLWRYFRKTRPRIVFSHAAKTNIWGMLAAAWAGIPRRVAMVEGLGYAFTDGATGQRTVLQRGLGRLLLLLYRAAFRTADCVIVLNDDDRQALATACRLPPNKIALLGGIGVPLDEWPPQPAVTSPITFTLTARLLREKGIFEFLAAARQVKAAYPQTRFWLLGAPDSNPGGIRAEALRPWIADNTVTWPGQVDVHPYLAQTSVFVLPSYREGVPRSTQEAMAMARPVITTDVPGCRDTVVEGCNGFLVPPRDVDALASAMMRFIREPALIEQMGRESRRLAEARFDMRVKNRQLMCLLGVDAENRSTPQR
jgi:glycosyltransferase involved in cell wall biosynthesis